MADFFAKIEATIMGRKTAATTAEMRKSGEAPEMPGISNYVFSRRWKPGKRDGFEVVSGSPTAFVRKLKRRKGKDIYLGGGGQLNRSFLQEDLVDELFLGLSPVLLGDGISTGSERSRAQRAPRQQSVWQYVYELSKRCTKLRAVQGIVRGVSGLE